MLNSFGNLIGSPNEDRLRTFHHNLRHDCQTKLTSLHKNKVEPTVLAAVCQIKQKQDAIPKIPLVQTWILVIQIYVCTYTWDIFSDISFDIISDKSFDTLSDDISSDILSDISFDIISDKSFDTLSDDISSDISFWHIFWHSFWHIFWHSFWHLSDISFDILSAISSDISFWHFFWHIFWHSFWHIFCHSFWQIFWHNTWGPARHTELTGSRLGSGTPHWTRMIAVGVRHTALNSRDRSWGPARHTELAGSQLGSGTPHCTRRIAVGVQHATLNSQDRGWGPARHTELTGSQLRRTTGGGRGGRGEGGGEGGEVTDIKSNNPHLTGGEKHRIPISFWWSMRNVPRPKTSGLGNLALMLIRLIKLLKYDLNVYLSHLVSRISSINGTTLPQTAVKPIMLHILPMKNCLEHHVLVGYRLWTL